MKKIKLLTASILVCLVGITAFAQDFNYLFTKAKEFEQNKKYVHALGTYYDAITLGQNEAFASYNTLMSTIKNGQPGFGNFNEFTLYDSWLALLTDAEQYWTEHAGEVYNIKIEKAIKGDVDYTTRTATYTIPVYIPIPFEKNTFTKKFYDITTTICEGLEKVYKSDWKGIPRPDFKSQMCYNDTRGPYKKGEWPFSSVAKNNSLEKTGIATIDGLYAYDYSIKHYTENGVFDEGPEPFIASWITGQPIFYKSPNGRSFESNGRTSMINVIVEVLDNNGKSLIKSQWFNVPFEYEKDNIYDKSRNFSLFLPLKNVPAEVMSILDSDNYNLQIIDMSLSYGQFLTGQVSTDKKNIPDDKNCTSEYFIGKMPVKKIPLEQLNHIQEKSEKFNQAKQTQIEDYNKEFNIFDHIKTIIYENKESGKKKAFSILNVSKDTFTKISGKKYSKSTVNKFISSNKGRFNFQNNNFTVLTGDDDIQERFFYDKTAHEEYRNYMSGDGKSFGINTDSYPMYFFRTDCDSAFIVWTEKDLDK